MITASLLLLLTAAGGANAPAGEVEEVVREALEIALAPEGGLRTDADLAAVRRGLAEGGDEAVPVLLGILEDGVLPPVEGKDARRLPPELEGVVLESLWARPRPILLPHLESVAANDGSDAARITGMRVLAGVGRAAEVVLLVHLAAPPAGETGVPAVRRDAFGDALTQVIARDPEGMWVVRDLFSDLEEGLLAPAVRAIGALETPDALHALSGFLGRVRPADSIVLAEITRLGGVVPHPINEYVLSQVRRQLGSSDPIHARHAMQACGSLEDYGAIPTLLDVLESPDFGLREAARGALAAISGRDFRTNHRAWEHWYESEQRWWNGEASACLGRLGHHETTTVLRAVLEVGNHRIHRHELAEELASVLTRREPEVVTLAISTLAQLGSGVAVPDLVRALDHRDLAVRESAWRALRTITGRDLPLDSAAWSELSS